MFEPVCVSDTCQSRGACCTHTYHEDARCESWVEGLEVIAELHKNRCQHSLCAHQNIKSKTTHAAHSCLVLSVCVCVCWVVSPHRSAGTFLRFSLNLLRAAIEALWSSSACTRGLDCHHTIEKHAQRRSKSYLEPANLLPRNELGQPYPLVVLICS